MEIYTLIVIAISTLVMGYTINFMRKESINRGIVEKQFLRETIGETVEKKIDETHDEITTYMVENITKKK